jgi:DNA primase
MNHGNLSQFYESEILPRLSAEDIFSSPVHHFHKSDEKWRGACPWHTSKSGTSFTVTPSAKIWWCQGCHAGGGPIQYLWKLKGGAGVTPKGKDFVDNVRELAERTGVPFPEFNPSGGDTERAQRRESRRAILRAVIEHTRQSIPDYARQYLHSRGFSDESFELLEIGFYRDAAEIRQMLKQQGHDLKHAEQAGVLWRKFEGYIIFPWADEYGHPLTLYGTWQSKNPPLMKDAPAWLKNREEAYAEWQTLPESEKTRTPWQEPQVPKKLALPNPKDDDGTAFEATKRSPLYFDRARLAGHKHLVLVEGVTDAALLQCQGDTRVVACVSASLSKLQAQTLARHGVETVTICLDPDMAGERGILSCVKSLDALGIASKVAPLLPGGLDPDEFVQANGIEAWHAHINQAKTPLLWDIDRLATNGLDQLQLVEALTPIKEQLAKLPEDALVAHLAYVKTKLNVSAEFIKGLSKEIRRLTPSAAQPEAQGNIQYTANFLGLVDIVEDENGKPAFLTMDENGLTMQSCVDRDGIRYQPPPVASLKWLLPRASEVFRHYTEDRDEQLFSDLVAYHRGISELPSDGHYLLFALWDMHTYLFEKSQYSPILWFFAIPERGKTRTGKGLIYVAWRGLHVESLRDAYLVRVSQDLKATIFFDVMDLWKKAERSGTEDILLLRYERGATVPRVMYPERGPHQDTVYYDIYGPTLAATNHMVNDILATRAVMSTMPQSDLRYERDVLPEDGLPFKERLTAFRARHIDSELPETDKPCQGRLGDILRPLVQITKLAVPSVETNFLEFCKQLEREKRDHLADGRDARLIQLLCSLEHEVSNGLLEAKKIGDKHNEGVAEKFQSSKSSITRSLKSLGFKTERPGGNTHVVVDPVLLNKLCARFGVVYAPGISAQSALTARPEEFQGDSACTFPADPCAEMKSTQNSGQKMHSESAEIPTGYADSADGALLQDVDRPVMGVGEREQDNSDEDMVLL